MALKVFQDLEIVCLSEEAEKCVSDITSHLDDGWSRDSEHEDQLNRETSSWKHFCFSCTEKPNRKAAHLWLVEESNKLEISNIVPATSGQLSYDEYNSILIEFYIRFAQPCANARSLKINLTQPLALLEDWVQPETARALKSFSINANRSTGRGHPRDSDRWMAFILEAHKQQEQLTPEQLRRWLFEEEGWPEQVAWTLCIDYEYARDLLSYYDQHK